MNESQVSFLLCLVQRNVSIIIEQLVLRFLELVSQRGDGSVQIRSRTMAPSKAVPVSPSCSSMFSVASPIESREQGLHAP